MNAAALLTRHGQTLTLVSRTTTTSIDPDTGAPVETVTETVEWTGTGSLQPNVGRDREGLTATAGGVQQVLVPYKCYLPADAAPEHGWLLRDSADREYEMITAPLNPGGANAFWLLNLDAPHGG